MLAPPALTGMLPGGKPRFSVIVAAYQARATLADAVDSALSQTSPPYEVVVCDDGSTDGTSDVLRPYGERIVLFRKQNGGEASAKNAAARAASGDFVVLLDADDIFLPERLEALGELAAARPDLDLLTTDATIEVRGEPVRRCYSDSFTFPSQGQRPEILRRNFVFGHAAVRRERLLAVGGFDESIRFTTDWECWIRLILTGSRVGLCPEPLARYRLLDTSLSAQRAGMMAGRIATLEKTARRGDLSPEERLELARRIVDFRRRLVVIEAHEALLERRPDARRRALAVARGAEYGVRERAKALASAAAPGLASRVLATRPRETTAGILTPPPAGGVGNQ